tara:strand:- start:122 stop:574 length:453 start_codon:yes stop_codon:yes gene_type:complete
MRESAKSTIVFASDHGGVNLRKILQKEAESAGFIVEDCGTHSLDSVDYPEQVSIAVENFIKLKAEYLILICGSGIGVSIAANRHPKLRAVVATNTTEARLSREHNHANCLCLGERLIGIDLAKEIFYCFVNTDPDLSDRHCRRVAKLESI